MTIIYCYDAYCGWCYGFSPVIQKIAEKYKQQFTFEVLSGGMIAPEIPQPIEIMAEVIKNGVPKIEELSEIKFGEDFMWHVNNPELSDWFPSSIKPAVALCILKEYYPDKAVDFAHDLQYALNFEGRDLTDNEAYRHILEKYEINAEEFYQKLESDEYIDKAHYEFQLVKQLKVESFPQVLLQVSESKFYLIAKGFTPFEQLDSTIQTILGQVQSLTN